MGARHVGRLGRAPRAGSPLGIAFRLSSHMFLLSKPSRREIESFLSAQRGKPLSYTPVGITRTLPASGYNVDHNRLRVGEGAHAFRAAVAAIKAWKMFDLGWVRL